MMRRWNLEEWARGNESFAMGAAPLPVPMARQELTNKADRLIDTQNKNKVMIV
jgi:hypothetical protein